MPEDRGRRSIWQRLGKKRLITGVLVIAVLAASVGIPLPYYILQPGSAEDTGPIITVEGGHKVEKGKLMLTTVYTIPADNIYYLAYAFLAPHSEIEPESKVAGNLDDHAYDRLMLAMMKVSQENAVVAALRALGKPVSIEHDGVQIWDIVPGSLSVGKLQIGDVITAVNGKAVTTREELTAYLADSTPGEVVTVDIRRQGVTTKVKVPLVVLSQPGEPHRTGLGIQPFTLQKVNSSVAVHFKTEGIGGPSAGLMFALQIINQLSGTDITKGYRIAGTGTIDDNGRVGQIGGVEHKVVAADRARAQIFFVPKDAHAGDTNTAKAIQEAKSIGTRMKIVPVSTLQEALDYLNQLPAVER